MVEGGTSEAESQARRDTRGNVFGSCTPTHTWIFIRRDLRRLLLRFITRAHPSKHAHSTEKIWCLFLKYFFLFCTIYMQLLNQ